MSDPDKPPPYSMYEWLRHHDTNLPSRQWTETSSLFSGIALGIVAGVHPDEWEIRDIVRADVKLPESASFLTPHPLAEFFQSRVYIEPLTSEYLHTLTAKDLRKLTIIQNGKNLDYVQSEIPPSVRQLDFEMKRIASLRDEKKEDAFAELKKQLIIFFENKKESPYGNEFHLGRKVDLNRECFVPRDAANWSDIFRGTERDEVKDLYTFLKNNPELTTLAIFHQDNEFSGHDPLDPNTGRQGGFYFYDTFGNATEDPDKDLVAELKENLIQEVKEAGFTVLNGADDLDDPDLNYIVENGYIPLEIQNDAGKFADDNGLEAAAVKLGRVGITKIRRAFVFEIPGKATHEEKKVVYDIIQRTFMEPFLAHTRSGEAVHTV